MQRKAVWLFLTLKSIDLNINACTDHLNNICNDADKYWWEGRVSQVKMRCCSATDVFIVYYSIFQKRTFTSVNRHKINTCPYKFPFISRTTYSSTPLWLEFSGFAYFSVDFSHHNYLKICIYKPSWLAEALKWSLQKSLFFSCWVVFLAG